jgi:flagellar protein FliL
MSDENESPEDESGEGQPKKGKKKLVIILAVLLLAGGGAAAFLTGMVGGKKEAPKEEAQLETESADAKASKKPAKPAYYELPEFLVNLSNNQNRVSFLKMSVTLELRSAAAAAIVDENKPKIMDAFNTYLRELRPSDLSGSAGIYRLREELMTRLNNTVEPDLVKDILFSEILVQ